MKLNRKLTRLIPKLVLPLIIGLLSLIPIQAQETNPAKPQSEPSANSRSTQTTPTASTDDDVLAQMLQQSVAEAKAYKAETVALRNELLARERLSAVDEKLLARYEKIIAAADLLIARLEKQCSTTSWFWGALKFKKC